MYKILTLNKISKTGTDRLPKDKYEILDQCDAPDGIVVRSFDMHSMELPESLLTIARAGAGVNNIPLDKCADKGIVVFNTPGANANAVKELVICGMILSSRRVVQGINWAQTLKGQDGVDKLVEKGKGDFVGPEIMGKTLGVVGLGAVGILVANAAVSLGMDVIGYDPFLSVPSAIKLMPQVKVSNDLGSVMAASDYLTLHLPLNKDTKYMFNEELFAKAKDGLRLINLARGELVCTDSLKKAIENGKVACYVIDFPDGNVLGNDKIITIPHLGASTPESEENCAYMAANSIKDYLETGNVVNSVNYPNCEVSYTGKKRVCVLSKNACPDKLCEVITAAGNKVSASASKERGGYAYAIFEVEGELADVSAVKGVDGVIAYRTLC